MRLSRVRFTVRRMMVAVAASSLVFALLAATGVPPGPGFAYGTVACLALVAIVALAEDARDLTSALAAVGCGIFFGAPAVDPCTRIGIILGPIVGHLARVATRRRAADIRCVPSSSGSCVDATRQCEFLRAQPVNYNL